MPLPTKQSLGRLLGRSAAALLIAAFCVMSSELAAEAPSQHQEPGAIVSAAWLAEHQRDQDLTVIDLQPAANFVQGHIEGAVNMPYERTPWTVGSNAITGMRPPTNELADLLKNHGLEKDDRIVIASSGRTPLSIFQAVRVYWSLKAIGVPRLHVLNGGIHAYERAGLPLKQGPQYVRPRRPYYERYAPDLLATADDVMGAAHSGSQLIDARDEVYFSGKKRRPFILQRGAIAGAVNLPATMFLTAKTNEFLGTNELEQLVPRPYLEGPVIVYSDIGLRAAMVWFVLYEQLGNKETRLYDGSMMDWVRYRPEGKP